jgi:electron transport complex protein RnfC
MNAPINTQHPSSSPQNSLANIIATSGQTAKRELFDFHGGIHPEEMKSLSSKTAIAKVAIPPRLILPLQQHIGKAAKVQVSVGEQVLKGQVLALADGMISASVHAPTSGVIESISEHPIPHPSGQSDHCIILIPDNKDQWCELTTCEDYLALDAQSIRQKVRAAGIAGMGGAGFPTDVKLSPPKPAQIDTLILNAAECEPYITADDRLIQERADEVIAGLLISASALTPQTCVIGIEDNKPEAAEALREAAKGTGIEISIIPTKYPSGGEKQLIKILTGKEVPVGKLPADIGIVCQNVGTVTAIYRAIRFGEPLISRITTLTGAHIEQRGNVEVMLGTPINWLIAQYGYQAAKQERLIMGGPMMGFTLADLNTPIVKTTNCLLAPDEAEMPLPTPAQACIRCGLCADACPAELLPQQLYWFSRSQEYEKAEHHNLFDCIECGACSYVCPSAIPLVQYYRHAKGEIKQQKADQLKSDQARERFEARQQRLESEQAAKAAKRKARADAAAKAQAEKQLAQAKPETSLVENLSEVGANLGKNEGQKAAVDAALARAQAKTLTAPAPEHTLEELKTAWEKAQSKLDKMFDALESAKENSPEQVDKLSRAVEKNQMRVNQAKQAFEKATAGQANTQTTPPSPKNNNGAQTDTKTTAEPDIEALKLAVDKAESKLIKMEDALANAQEEHKEKLTRAVAKNRIRVEQATATLAEAIGPQTSTTKNIITEASPSSQNDTAVVSTDKAATQEEVDLLATALDKAESKLCKMEDAFDNADEVHQEKLSRAVAKNKTRVVQAQLALDTARQHLQIDPQPKPNDGDK